MPYCGNCGRKLTGEARFCPNCGRENAAPGAAPEPAGAVGQTDADPPGQDSFVGETMSLTESKIYAVFAYLGILILVPALTARRSPFVRYHLNQGLAMLFTAVAAAAGIGILSAAFLSVSIRLYSLIVLLWVVWWIALVVGVILGVVNAGSGKQKPLPVVGGFDILKQ